MKKSKIYGFILCLLIGSGAFAQQIGHSRFKLIQFTSDTIRIDTLSLVTGSVLIADSSGIVLNDTLYKLDLISAKIILKKNAAINKSKRYTVTYRVLPIDFSKRYYHKDKSVFTPDAKGMVNPFVFNTSTAPQQDLFSLGGLSKNGSISRGLSFGNNQDVVVNSSLNMQLSGKISDDIEILAAITDNNVPIQPDGNTQQIQDFDKVFIQLFNKTNKLIAGDYEMIGRDGYFLRYTKKAQGLMAQNITKMAADSGKSTLTTTASIAVSKGKYNRATITAVEGNQGPYRLIGAQNELYIIVLAGTEKVYFDGRLLTRGQDNDYTIDYNTAEVKFTPKRMITKDSRIVVEFEYSDKSYTRYIMQAGTSYKSKKYNGYINYFSEEDSKNQPLLQDMDDKRKKFLSGIGDSINLATYPNISTVPFNADEILYKMKDTIVSGIKYDSIYVYSTSPDSAKYQLGFSSVGANKGNYVQLATAANGKVYKWIAPVNGIKQGSYDPVILLVTPKKQSMLVAGGSLNISKNLNTALELAMSDQDQNLYSSKDDQNNKGFALKWGLNYNKVLKKDSLHPLLFLFSANTELEDKRFLPIERYRAPEFERDWNIISTKPANQEMSTVLFSITNKKDKLLTYQLSNYMQGTGYNGFQNGLIFSVTKFKFKIDGNGSFVKTSDPVNNTSFLRHSVGVSRKIKGIQFGVNEKSEDNRFKSKLSDSLTLNSKMFNSIEFFVKSADTAKKQYGIGYLKRWDYIPQENSFKLSTYSEDISTRFERKGSLNTNFVAQAIYRRLFVMDTSKTTVKPDESVVGRLEFRKRALKGAIVSNTFYEFGTGMEQKKEYSYVEVAPGKGIYTWTDYNGNGIKELNEFEISQFPDQANYIRVFTPTNQYIKAYTNMFNEVLNITPQLYTKAKTFGGKFISKFSTQTIYRIDRKTTYDDMLQAFNPFLASSQVKELASLNSNFRNTLYFNRNSSRFGVDLNYQNNSNKILLTSGYESRSAELNSLRIRYNINRTFLLTTEIKDGIKTSKSDYFSSRDFNIKYDEIQPQIEFQKGTAFRTSLSYKYSNKINTINDKESAILNNIGLEMRHNVASKGSLQSKINIVLIKYSGVENTSVGYEMLEGLKAGKNYTWNLSYQRNLGNNLQMNINYDGRKPDGLKVIHVGSVQFRAFF